MIGTELAGQQQQETSWDVLSTPALYNGGKKCLLWIISNVSTKAIDGLPEVSIRTMNNFWNGHSSFEWLEDFGKGQMEELVLEFSEMHIFFILFVHYQIIELRWVIIEKKAISYFLEWLKTLRG
jgi:hypothetical protein